VLPTANCLAKPQDCVPVASIAVDLIGNVWWMHSNANEYSGRGTPNLTIRWIFRVLKYVAF
jgi:hypothetical protein